jgi:hypothetical protein
MAAQLHDRADGEAAIAAQMALKPLYDRLSALLGQRALPGRRGGLAGVAQVREPQ